MPIMNIKLKNQIIEQMQQYKYLESIQTSDSGCSVEIIHNKYSESSICSDKTIVYQ